ncbi:hypothetical protein C0995_016172, partial [Termitomyces sp. Mi166
DDIVSKASQIPWEAFHLSVPKDDPAIAAISQSTLLEDLVDLAHITIIGGKPQHVWPPRPKHGIIGDHLVGEETSCPRFVLLTKKNTALATETSESAGIPIFAPKPIIPLGPARAAFEVRATEEVDVELTPLTATFLDENALPAQNDSDANENTDNAAEDLSVHSPHHRGNKQPLGMLHYDEEATPPTNRIAPFVRALSPAISKSDSDVSSGSGSAKGWARLRAKAPPAIKITSPWRGVSNGVYK